MTLEDLARILQPLRARVAMILSRAVVVAVDDTTLAQTLRVRGYSGELLSGVERLHEYGFTSHPIQGPEGAIEALLAAPGGNRDGAVAVAVGDRTLRLKGLAEGEVALYDDQGSVVHLKRGGHVRVASASLVEIDSPSLVVDCETATVEAQTVITLVAPTVRVEGNLEVTGDVVSSSDSSPLSLATFRSTYNVHRHDENDNAPGPTDPPNQQV